MGVETAVLLAVTAAAAGYGAYQQHEASVEQKKQAKDMEAQQLALQSQAEERANAQDATQSAAQARERQRLLAASATGRQSTVLTSPLGLPGQAPTTRNTLIGG